MYSVPCSIIVPLFNKVELTRACVAAVRAHTDPSKYELVLVDNASSDSTPEFCAGLPEDVVVIRNDVNLGFSKACNQGAEAATGEHLLFLNNDTEVHAGWLEPMLAWLEEPQVSIVGSKLLFPDGTIQHCGVLLTKNPALPEPFGAIHHRSGGDADEPEVNVPRRFQVVTGAAMLVRRSTFEDVGGFDESFWNGYEDVDLCLKVGVLGHTVMYEPRSVITHHESASGIERFRKTDENVALLMRRWGNTVRVDVEFDRNGDPVVDPAGSLNHLLAEFREPLEPAHADLDVLSPDEVARELTFERLEAQHNAAHLERRRGNAGVVWPEGEALRPLVSVVVTDGGASGSLERSVASALGQTHESIEVLIVGPLESEAGCPTADSRVRRVDIELPADQSMGPAFDMARGSWIMWIDTATILQPDAVASLLFEAKTRRLEVAWGTVAHEIAPGDWIEAGSPEPTPGRIMLGSALFSAGLRRIGPNSRCARVGETADQNLWRRMFNAGVHFGFADHLCASRLATPTTTNLTEVGA